MPQGIGRPPLLSELRLDGNKLISLPDTIGRLTALKVLSLSNNTLLSLPSSMAALRSLESLDLSNNADLNLDALPEFLFRLNEMHSIFHSKERRRKVITRAINFRPVVRRTVLKEVLSDTASGAAAGDQLDDDDLH